MQYAVQSALQLLQSMLETLDGRQMIFAASSTVCTDWTIVPCAKSWFVFLLRIDPVVLSWWCFDV